MINRRQYVKTAKNINAHVLKTMDKTSQNLALDYSVFNVHKTSLIWQITVFRIFTYRCLHIVLGAYCTESNTVTAN